MYKGVSQDDHYSNLVLYQYDGLQWYQNYCMTKQSFLRLHEYLHDGMYTPGSNFKQIIPVTTKMLCCLKILVDGSF